MCEQTVSYTPSLQFNFDQQSNERGTQKTDLQYSSTPFAQSKRTEEFFKIPILSIEDQKHQQQFKIKRLKTKQLFENFDSNFTVIFGEEQNISFIPQNISQSNIAYESSNHLVDFELKLNPSENDLQKLSLLNYKQNSQNVNIRVRHKKLPSVKQNKKNIQNCKKNNFLQPLVIESKSCLYDRKNVNSFRTKNIFKKEKYFKQKQILQAGVFTCFNGFSKTLKSNTLDFWKVKFQIKRKQLK